uniref:G-protein coupled receptors family 2 profile 2 domain-containing protein n=1 Tax=Strigamia maritima TaxID=126957 RepID=T1IW10_STRMM
MFSCYRIFYFFLLNLSTFYSYSLDNNKFCQKHDAILYDGDYFVAQDTCEKKMTVDPSGSCRQCNLIIHYSACLPSNGTLGKTWCDESKSCGSFRCSSHRYEALKRFADQCVNHGPITPCNNSRSQLDMNYCGVILTPMEPTSYDSCIPMTSLQGLKKRFDRIPITNIQLDFFENSSNIDSSVTGPVYIRSHGSAKELRRRPLRDATHVFLQRCAMSLLARSRFILLYFPAVNSAVEIGRFNLTHTSNSTILMCTLELAAPSDSFMQQLRNILMFVGISLSLFGLMCTAIISILLVEHRNVPGFNLLSLVSSLFVAYVCVPIGVLNRSNICLVAGTIHIFTVLASVFWMNVVAFDIWQSLSTVQHLDQYRTSEHCIRLIRYSLYAWGVPACILTLGGVLDSLAAIPPNFRPGFVNGCWFSINPTLATHLLYNGPIGLIMIANAIFFLLTAKIVFQAQRQRLTTMRVADSQRYHFSLYVKLFLVMGLTWVMESLTGPIRSTYYELVSDFVNTLQGFFIFFIFGCKMRAWKRLERCCGRKKGRLAVGATFASSYPSTSIFRSERDLSFKVSNNVRNSITVSLTQNDTSM